MNDTDNYDFYKPYLADQERVLWIGKPEKGRLFTGRDFVMLPFSVIWLSFSVIWEIAAFQSGAPLFSLLFGLPFVAIGLYLLFGGIIQKIRLKGRTFYAITNQKIIIKRGNKIEMYDGWDLPPMSIQIHKNGNGTILFQETLYSGGRRSRSRYFMLENLSDFVQAQNAVNRMDRYQVSGPDLKGGSSSVSGDRWVK